MSPHERAVKEAAAREQELLKRKAQLELELQHINQQLQAVANALNSNNQSLSAAARDHTAAAKLVQDRITEAAFQLMRAAKDATCAHHCQQMVSGAQARVASASLTVQNQVRTANVAQTKSYFQKFKAWGKPSPLLWRAVGRLLACACACACAWARAMLT